MQSFAPHFDEMQNVLSVGQCQRHSAKCQNDRAGRPESNRLLGSGLGGDAAADLSLPEKRATLTVAETDLTHRFLAP
jgi:hypothetical protein